MKRDDRMNRFLWSSAAALGGLWASVEIIVGSALHNLRIPFSGAVLASAGVVVMVAGHWLRPMNGLFWRTGVVCAVLKSVSPSSILLGPMIGILSEACVLELMVRLTRGRIFGYLIGGMVAVVLTLMQQVLSYMITFGPAVVDLYTHAYTVAARVLKIEWSGPIDLVLVVACVHAVLGLGATLMGFRVAQVARTAPGNNHHDRIRPQDHLSGFATNAVRRFSIPLLVGHIVVLGLFLVLVHHHIHWAALALLTVQSVVVLTRYPDARKRLARPGLWIECALVAVLASVFLGGLREETSILNWEGLHIGGEMCLRAFVVILGFSAVSVELRNPLLVQWFLHRGLDTLSKAVGTAFGILPAVMHDYDRHRSFIRFPVRTLAHSVVKAFDLAGRGNGMRTDRARYILLVGERGTGKTTVVQNLVARLESQDITVGGIFSPAVFKGDERSGFDVVDISSGERAHLCEQVGDPGVATVGRYRFFPDGVAFGNTALMKASRLSPDVVVVDEVGPLELRGEGWSQSLESLVREAPPAMIWTIRPTIVEDIIARWELYDPMIVDLKKSTQAEIPAW